MKEQNGKGSCGCDFFSKESYRVDRLWLDIGILLGIDFILDFYISNGLQSLETILGER